MGTLRVGARTLRGAREHCGGRENIAGADETTPQHGDVSIPCLVIFIVT